VEVLRKAARAGDGCGEAGRVSIRRRDPYGSYASIPGEGASRLRDGATKRRSRSGSLSGLKNRSENPAGRGRSQGIPSRRDM